MKTPIQLLALDSIGGLIAGTLTLLAAPLLTTWYAWPEGLALVVGWANLGYGCYSGCLALFFRREPRLHSWAITLLILANAGWALHCFTRAWLLQNSASYLGLGHLILEGLWVGGLAYLEARILLPYSTKRAPVSPPHTPDAQTQTQTPTTATATARTPTDLARDERVQP